MSLSLTPELEQYLADKVSSGLYQTSSEVMREALRLMRERDALYEGRVNQIRRDLAEGFAELQRGESSPGDEVRGRLHTRRKANRQPET
ncbi:MAG: type II toxin-antitoxin system ParD family antitoxin [Vulcanimicrobiaceae bacterium]